MNHALIRHTTFLTVLTNTKTAYPTHKNNSYMRTLHRFLKCHRITRIKSCSMRTAKVFDFITKFVPAYTYLKPNHHTIEEYFIKNRIIWAQIVFYDQHYLINGRLGLKLNNDLRVLICIL